MKLTKAGELQARFKNGLQIVDDSQAGLVWMGDGKAWQHTEQDLIDLHKQENKEQTYANKVIK